MMKMNSIPLLAALLTLGGGLAAVPVAAQEVTYRVSLDTSGLIPYIGPTQPAFALDFQLNDGSGALAGVNTVKLWGFNAGSGGAIGPALSDGFYPVGHVGGDLSTSATLTDDVSFENEIVQTFTPGDRLSFFVTTTTNSDGDTPDELSFATGVYDPNFPGFEDFLTSGPGNAAFTIDLDGPNPTVSTYATPDFNNPTLNVLAAPTVTAVPEPGLLALLMGIGVTSGLVLRRRR